ncbi:unnamed protein product [Bursaphelenchus xylophilus]|uniref:(pine wood nematode) hypothetical protein n=1 Tax=Bursaphelenchus xylophilus TaxID=6326 RepID=A0A1I7S0C9_BURXY|nr:unnamed protein product [Bursaphelenchus xylophilus]CAG9132209.1 unnamed protein product [Bursaphelenchus xylophilus]
MSVSVLKGIKVLDFSRILAAPYASQLLADHGATVWKIERPVSGDEVRRWAPPQVNGQSCYFVTVNRSKKSIALDLGKKEGLEIARKLATKSDVLLENFKTGQMKKFSLDYETLSKLNSKLIYCSVTGYGSTGPYANDPGFDVIAEAVGGFMSITGPRNGEPCKAGVAVIDLLTGMHAYSGILMALLNRQQTGQGQRVECNLLATQMATLANIASNYLNAGVLGKAWGTEHESIVPYQAFRTKDDRYYVVGAADNKAFKELVSLLELPELADDPDYETNPKRVENREKLLKIIGDRFASKPLEYWRKHLRSRHFPSGPVNNVHEAFEFEQTKHLQLVQPVEHPVYGEVKTVGNTTVYNTIHNGPRSAPPLLGEHTKDILQEELEIGDKTLEELQDKGVIGW